MLSAESRFEVNTPDVAAKVIDGEAIVMNLANGHYYSLDGVGATVWEMLDAGLAVTDIIAALSARYGLADVEVGTAVTALAADLMSEGLIRVRAEAAASPTDVVGGPDAYDTPRLVKYTDMAELLALDPPMPGLGVAS